MQYKLFEEHKFKFFSMGSGSSGNCFYIGTLGCGILIDAGLGIRYIESTLKKHEINWCDIKALLLTHEHTDHVKTTDKIVKKYNIPVFTTVNIHNALKSMYGFEIELKSDVQKVTKDKTFKIYSFQITPFDVPHDSCDNVGYMIRFDKQTLVLITDAGQITPTIQRYAKQANHLIIEANYDIDMLMNGGYPYYLKKRMSNGKGHLSNVQSGELIAQIHHSALRNVFLCHLSKNNNTPDKALQTVLSILTDKNINTKTISIEVLQRSEQSGYRVL